MKANTTATVFFIIVAGAFAIGPGCKNENPPKVSRPAAQEKDGATPKSPAKRSDAPEAADAIQQPEGGNIAVVPNMNAPLQERDGEKCRPVFQQTGKGCDMEGIVAQILPERKGNGGIPQCYLTHVVPPREGKMRLAFALTPDGKATGFRWMLDDFKNEALETCLVAVFKGLQYPAPGDVPCQVVYPLTFVPEVNH